PHGIMIHTTIEFARSISKDCAQDNLSRHLSGLPKDSLAIKLWYDPVWRTGIDDVGPRPRRARLTVASADLELSVSDRLGIRFQTLSPKFAERFGDPCDGRTRS
ncbi:MAG: hypothetical protein ACREQV_26400, partial [Candidatus Binatia bacterium]